MRVSIRSAFIGLAAVAALACGDAGPEAPATSGSEAAQAPGSAEDYLLKQAVGPTPDERLARVKAQREARKVSEAAALVARDAKAREVTEAAKALLLDPLRGAKTSFKPVEGMPDGFPKILVGSGEILKAYAGENGTGVVVVRFGGEIKSVSRKMVSRIKAGGWTLMHQQAEGEGRHSSVFQRGKKNAQLTLIDDPDGAILQAFVFELDLEDPGPS